MQWSLIRRKLGRVDRAVAKAIEKGETPGAVILARMPRDGEVIEHESVAGNAVSRPERIAMQRETIFDLASLTKPLATTTAVMLLVNEGVIDLDDPVAKHVPMFGERDKDAVTVRHLLTHSSGLKPWRGFHDLIRDRERKTGERWLSTPQAKEWIIERICRSGLVHEVGEAAVYGDLDFIVLGALVEAVSHQTLDVFCQERVFGPLGMGETGFIPVERTGPVDLDPARHRRIAATENCAWRDRILWGEVHDPNASAMGGVAGHAGLFGTADDVMRFATTLLDVWHGRSDALPASTLRTFLTPQHLPENSDWALGWDTPSQVDSTSGQYFSKASVGHLGFTGTSLWIDLDREAVVVMLTNRIHLVAKRSRFTLRPRVHDLLMESFQAGQ